MRSAPSSASSAASACSVAQVLRVRARDVDRHVVGVRIDAGEADQVVVDGALDRRGRVLADVQAEDAAAARESAPAGRWRMKAARPSLLKPSRLISAVALDEAEHARLRIARLRQRRDRADLDAAEAERAEGVDAAAVLVEPGGQADAVRESAGRRASPDRRRGAGRSRATSGVCWIAAIAPRVRSCASSGSSPNRNGRARG